MLPYGSPFTANKTGIVFAPIALGGHNTGSLAIQGGGLSQTALFDKFYRGQNVRRQVAGTGMGLSVAREIVRAHGGDVYLAESNPGGTEFVLAIPVNGDMK